MRFQSRCFWLAKDADYADEYQDAFELDSDRGLAAIADGVSSALFSGPWARILTKATVSDPPNLDDSPQFLDWLGRQRTAWQGQIDTRNLPWNVRPRLVHGAMTTLLWVELVPDGQSDDLVPGRYRLRATAIGDCCLFQCRQGECLRTFPMQAAAEFGLDPAVIGSIDRKLDHLLEFQVVEDECWPGDLLVLATDALALWAMGRAEAGDPVAWDNYWDVSEEAWREEIMSLRRESEMRYDDTTLVLLRVIEETAAPLEAIPEEAEPLVVLEIVEEDGPPPAEPAVPDVAPSADAPPLPAAVESLDQPEAPGDSPTEASAPPPADQAAAPPSDKGLESPAPRDEDRSSPPQQAAPTA